MKTLAPLIICLALLGPASTRAQMLDPQPAKPASAQSSQSSNPPPASSGGGDSSFLGKDVPVFDPGSEIITWDGKSWNINNNRIFEARLEKYLNSPEETSEEDIAYNALIEEILSKLSPSRITHGSVDEAFKLLPKASEFNRDANLCDSIADQVYSAWLARRSNERLVAANRALEEEKKRIEWNQQMTIAGQGLTEGGAPRNNNAAKEWAEAQKMRRTMMMQPYTTRLVELEKLKKTNEAKTSVSELQSKIEFQALIVQLFFQRRFHHVLMASRFYSAIFNDGDSKLRVKGQAQELFATSTGLPATTGTLGSIANEFIRDVAEGIDAYEFLLEKDELESATKRLAETFIVGEYMPKLRTLSREKKRRALSFLQKSNQLISAIQVKDYALAEKLVGELEKTAKDFDNSKPMAAIQTAKTLAAMHLAKAKNAAVSGDQLTLETQLAEATKIWPRNPALAEVSGMIFEKADTQQRALVDFDQLLSQKNYRQIFDDKERFIVATGQFPDRATQLRQVLENMQEIEGAIMRAQEIEKRGDFAGAWESAERAFQQYPEDSKLNQVRANLTTKAADFVRAVKRAEELEERNQPGSSLAWYLKAQQYYPPSEFARDGIDRIRKKILPDAG